MRSRPALLIFAVSLGCGPEVLEPSSVVSANERSYLVIERDAELEIEALNDGRSVQLKRDEREIWHLLSIDRGAIQNASPNVDQARIEASTVVSHPREEIEACSPSGVLDHPRPSDRAMLYELSSVGAKHFELADGQWRPTELPLDGPLGDLALRIPIRSTCRSRTWRAEPFFDRSPLLEFGTRIRDYVFDHTWPRAIEVRGLAPLGDGNYLIYSLAALAVARPGESISEAATLLIGDLPPPPVEWSPPGTELGWQFHALRPWRMSGASEPSFLVVLQARPRGQEEDGEDRGRALAEIQYRAGRLQLGRILHQASRLDAELIEAASPLDDRGGFVGIGPSALFIRTSSVAPIQTIPKLWSPASVDEVGLPGAEFVISVHDGGFWVGDPRRGFEGLRFESAGPSQFGCLHTGRMRQGDQDVALANCGRELILVRGSKGWAPFYPWVPTIDGCVDEERHCGRPTLEQNARFTSFWPGPDDTWMVSKDDCGVAFTFELDEDQCARAERFEVETFVVELPDAELDLYGLNRFDDAWVLVGQGGLAVRVVPNEETFED